MQPIRFRCCLNMLAFPVMFGPMAVAHAVFAVMTGDGLFWLCAAAMLCVSLAGLWGVQWIVEFTPEGVAVRHAWSGKHAALPWNQIGAVQRIYAKGDYLLLSERPLDEKETLRIWRRTYGPSYAGVEVGCLCVRVAATKRMNDVQACLAAHGLTVPEKAVKGPWQL